MGRVAPNKRRLRRSGCSHISESVPDRFLTQKYIDMEQIRCLPLIFYEEIDVSVRKTPISDTATERVVRKNANCVAPVDPWFLKVL